MMISPFGWVNFIILIQQVCKQQQKIHLDPQFYQIVINQDIVLQVLIYQVTKVNLLIIQVKQEQVENLQMWYMMLNNVLNQVHLIYILTMFAVLDDNQIMLLIDYKYRKVDQQHIQQQE
ncbi:unnamed protein product [Paramecium sonneborni]|uniref:Uncharacterized protein n=1 Tax=Paramecium sonneborni TaxID=65129 RepID=A0A8S1R5I1_9CILI|nr:unnamed protein product [Paramecium sonneborni]